MAEVDKLAILCVDQHREDVKALEQFVLRNHLPYRLTFASSGNQAEDILTEKEFDLVLLDHRLPGGSGFDLLKDLADLPVIFITSETDVTAAVRALRAGAMDYLVKDTKRAYLGDLPSAIEYAVRTKRQEDVEDRYYRQLEDIVAARTQVLMEANQRLRDETEQRAQAVEDYRKTMAQQAAIDDLSTTMAGTLDLETIYRSILAHLQEFFELELMLLTSFNSRTKVNEVKYHWQSASSAEEEKLMLPARVELEGYLSQVIQSGELLSVSRPGGEGPRPDSRYPLRCEEDCFQLPDPGEPAPSFSLLLAPLIVEDQVIGVLGIQYPRSGAYDYRDAALLSRTTNVVALGLRKAYLYETSEQQIDRLSALHTIDRAILSNLSLPTILDTLLDQLSSLLRVDAADVLIYHPDLEALKIISQIGFWTNPLQHTDLQLGEDPGGKAAAAREPVRYQDLREMAVNFHRSADFQQEGFQAYYGYPMVAKGDMVGVLEVFHRVPLELDPEEEEFLERMAGLGALAIAHRNLHQDLKRSNQELLQAYDAIIKGWAEALELRGIETRGHARRVVELSVELARTLGLHGEALEDIRRGAYLHDIGKMGIPDDVLLKEERLTREERHKIGQHPIYAYQMLEDVEAIQSALEIPLYHHERWDGMGYPEGLQGEEIPLPARIFAVVDVWDSLLSDKPYREAWARENALAHIKERAGKHFDPRVVEAFLEIVEERM